VTITSLACSLHQHQLCGDNGEGIRPEDVICDCECHYGKRLETLRRHPELWREQARTITYDELMYRLSHCDECNCEHGNPVAGCICVCHAEGGENNESDDS
jgi:hypothetical protein